MFPSYESLDDSASSTFESTFEVEQTISNRDKKSVGRSAFLIGCTVVVLLITLRFAHHDSTPTMTTASESFGENADFGDTDVICADADISIHATNEYGVFSAPYPYLQNGELLVEPYKNTTLGLSGNFLSEEGRYEYRWKFDEHMKGVIHSGQSIVFTRKDVGSDYVTVYVIAEGSDEAFCKLRTPVYYKYVKRELRDLTLADRERFLDAMYALWKYDTRKGRELFGDEYVGVSTFVENHAQASGDIMCDMFHDGSGFLTHHLALTNSFENSIRLVDPSVTVPYWDFTREGETIYRLGEEPSYMLEMNDFLTETWFGSVNEENEIADSRWAHISMPKAQNKSTITPNSYGYLRSYWNNNNSPEVTRNLFDVCGLEATSHPVPTCGAHFRLLNATSLGDFQVQSPAEGHGPMHVHLGGMWAGCDQAWIDFTAKWSDLMEENLSDEDLESLGIDPTTFSYGNTATRRVALENKAVKYYYHIYRKLWRSHVCAVDTASALLVCPESCDEGTPTEECACSVPSLVDGSMDWENLYPCIFEDEDSQILFRKLIPDDMMKDLTLMISTASVAEGEMIESSSPADPLFWLIHPIIEKLLAAKRLNNYIKYGDQQFSKWETADGSGEDWFEYSMYTFSEGAVSWHPGEYVCPGHGKDDNVLPDKLPLTSRLHAAADLDNNGVITNYEFFIALNPNDPELNDYVFDDFTWSHCMESDGSLFTNTQDSVYNH
jgi:hypothetical protein